jgi:orotate phosphoribosyltransferase
MKSEREQLIDWLDLFSVKTGEEFTLASGQKSNVYVDVKKTAFHNKVNKLLAKLLFEKMVETFHHVEAVAGVVLGGCHLASIVAMHHPIGIDVVYVRKEAKNHGTQNLIEQPNCSWQEHIVVIEDVVTTGTSAVEAAKLLQKDKYNVKGILAVVDRREKKDPYLGSYPDEFPFAALINFEELHP